MPSTRWNNRNKPTAYYDQNPLKSENKKSNNERIMNTKLVIFIYLLFIICSLLDFIIIRCLQNTAGSDALQLTWHCHVDSWPLQTSLVLCVNCVMYRILCRSINGSGRTEKISERDKHNKPSYSWQIVFSYKKTVFIFKKTIILFEITKHQDFTGKGRRPSKILLKAKAGVILSFLSLVYCRMRHAMNM
jgi:hypothetical protein